MTGDLDSLNPDSDVQSMKCLNIIHINWMWSSSNLCLVGVRKAMKVIIHMRRDIHGVSTEQQKKRKYVFVQLHT